MSNYDKALENLKRAHRDTGYFKGISDSINQIYMVRSGLSLNPDNPAAEAFNDGVRWATSMLIENLTALAQSIGKESA